MPHMPYATKHHSEQKICTVMFCMAYCRLWNMCIVGIVKFIYQNWFFVSLCLTVEMFSEFWTVDSPSPPPPALTPPPPHTHTHHTHTPPPLPLKKVGGGASNPESVCKSWRVEKETISWFSLWCLGPWINNLSPVCPVFANLSWYMR